MHGGQDFFWDACCMMMLPSTSPNAPATALIQRTQRLLDCHDFPVLTPSFFLHLPSSHTCPLLWCAMCCAFPYIVLRCVSPGGAQQCRWCSWCSGPGQGPHSPHLPGPHALPHRTPHEQAAGPPDGRSRGTHAVYPGGPLLLTAGRCQGRWASPQLMVIASVRAGFVWSMMCWAALMCGVRGVQGVVVRVRLFGEIE